MTAAGRELPLPQVLAAIARAGARNPMLGIGTGDHGAGDPAPVTPEDAERLVGVISRWLPAADRRLAASLVVVGYAARLVGPAVAVLLGDGIQLDLRAAAVRHSFDPGQGFQLWLPGPAGWRPDLAGRAVGWQDVVIDGHLRPVVAAVRAVEPVATRVLWGNVASGTTGALAALVRAGGLSPARALAAGAELLTGPLAGSGQLEPGPGGLRFTRRTCCLYYRLDRRATCGDCPLPAG